MKAVKKPCTECGKPISKGYSSWLSGIFACEDCVIDSPKLQGRLDLDALAELNAKKGKKVKP